MDQLVGQLQIGDSLDIGVEAEIAVVAHKVRAQPVVVVKHGGHAVEAEAVEVVLLQPELEVGEQEVDDLVLAVVEQLGVPRRVILRDEVLVVGAVKAVETLVGVLAGVGMHHVQKHEHAHLVRGVDEVLEVLGVAVPRGGGEEIRHLIAKGGVVGMLHDGHELDGVVPCLLHAVEDAVGKFAVGADGFVLLRHAHVGFVDEQGAQLALAVAAVRPAEGAIRSPDLAVELVGLGVAHHAAYVGGDAVELLAVFRHLHLDALAVHQRVLAVEFDLPVAVFQTGHGVAFAVPVVEIADEVHLVRARRPLAVHPTVLRAGDAVVEVAVGERRKVCLVAQQSAARVRMALHAQGNIAVIRLQPWVDGQDLVLRLL